MEFELLTKISVFDQNFDFWPKFRFLNKISVLTKISTFDQISIFEQNFGFDQNFNFWPNFDFWPKFRFLTKIWIFDQHFQKNIMTWIGTQNLHENFRNFSFVNFLWWFCVFFRYNYHGPWTAWQIQFFCGNFGKISKF